MSIALERIEPSGFGAVMACGSASIFEASQPLEERRIVSGGSAGDHDSCSSSSTSSIGRNSDDDDGDGERSSDGDDCEENEAQSSYKGPLDMMDSFDEVLPIRRGISKFYNGKSKSFTSLSDASTTSSIKDIAKPENSYTRRRRNLLAINHLWDKNRNFPLRSNGGGISKRPISSSKSLLALAVAMSSSEMSSSTSEDSSSSPSSRSPTRLPPLPPQTRASHGNIACSPPARLNFSPWRSFSVADLPQCATAGTTNSSRYLMSDKADC